MRALPVWKIYRQHNAWTDPLDDAHPNNLVRFLLLLRLKEIWQDKNLAGTLALTLFN